MKKVILASIALAAFATTANAQLTGNQINNSTNSGRASDQSSVSLTVVVPNVLTLSPDANSSSITLTQAQTQAGAGNYYVLPTTNTWTVWSNREYFVYYQAPANFTYSNTTGATDDGDENTTWPIGNMKMEITANNTGGSILNGYGAWTSLTHAAVVANNGEGTNSIAPGTELIDEGMPGNLSFTTNYEIQSPGYSVVGGTYTATVYIWAIQE